MAGRTFRVESRALISALPAFVRLCGVTALFVGASFVSRAAFEPVTVRSQSGQFMVRGIPLGPPLTGFPTSAVPYLRLDPSLTAVSLERIRQTLVDETLGLKTRWKGLITVAIHPVTEDNPPAHITSTRFTDGWGYRLELPERIGRRQFVDAATRVILAEIANRNAKGREAELPPWLVEGLSAELQSGLLSTLAIEPAPPMDQTGRKPEPLRSVRDILRRRPALTLDELNMPTAELLSGNNAELYRACAHLFVHELLRLRGGRDALRDMLVRLPENLNWQTTFLRSFATQFPRLIEVDKWYALQVVHVSGRDPMSVWPLETTRRQLDEILATKVQVRLGTNDLPIDTFVPLNRIVTEWEFERQRVVLSQKVERLLALRPRAAPELAQLVDGYAHALQTYVNGRPPKFKPSPLAEGGTSRLPPAVRTLLEQLNELDARREKLRENAAGSAKGP